MVSKAHSPVSKKPAPPAKTVDINTLIDAVRQEWLERNGRFLTDEEIRKRVREQRGE